MSNLFDIIPNFSFKCYRFNREIIRHNQAYARYNPHSGKEGNNHSGQSCLKRLVCCSSYTVLNMWPIQIDLRHTRSNIQ